MDKSCRTLLFWAVTQRVVEITYDVSEQPIGTIFKTHESKIGFPETTVRN